MLTIYKYELNPSPQRIELPKAAEILSLAFQEDQLYIWVKVSTDVELELRRFEIFGTGHRMSTSNGNARRVFIGTAHHPGGLVFHVFERLDNLNT